MAQKILEARAIMFPGPMSNKDAVNRGASALTNLNIHTNVKNLPLSDPSSLETVKIPMRSAIAEITTEESDGIPIFLIGMEISGPIVGTEALLNPEVTGAVLISPAGMTEPRRGLFESSPIYAPAVGEFYNVWRKASAREKRKIAVMTPDNLPEASAYLSEARHVAYSSGQTDWLSVYGGIEHLLTTGTELEKLAVLIKENIAY